MACYLEMGVREDGSGGAKVFDLGESGHEFGSSDAALLVHQLDGRPLAVVGHAVADEHVEFAVVVLDGQHHGHRLADLDQTRHFAGPRSLAHLDLHPAADVVSGEIRPHHVQHVDGERPEGDGLFVLVVPRAAELPGLVPHFLHLRIELDDDGVLEERSRAGLCVKRDRQASVHHFPPSSSSHPTRHPAVLLNGLGGFFYRTHNCRHEEKKTTLSVRLLPLRSKVVKIGRPKQKKRKRRSSAGAKNFNGRIDQGRPEQQKNRTRVIILDLTEHGQGRRRRCRRVSSGAHEGDEPLRTHGALPRANGTCVMAGRPFCLFLRFFF